MWCNSTAAPATVIEDEPFITTQHGEGKGEIESRARRPA